MSPWFENQLIGRSRRKVSFDRTDFSKLIWMMCQTTYSAAIEWCVVLATTNTLFSYVMRAHVLAGMMRQRVSCAGSRLICKLDAHSHSGGLLISLPCRSCNGSLSRHGRQSKFTFIPQNQILISSSLTALGSSTPDSVMMPEMRSGGV